MRASWIHLGLLLSVFSACSIIPGGSEGSSEDSRSEDSFTSVRYAEGTVLKGSGPDLFRVEERRLRLIPDARTLVSLGLSSEMPVLVSDAELVSMPKGPSYPSVADYVTNLVDGNQVWPQLLADLRAAKESINIQMYLMFNDPIGRQVADILIEKANNPVRPVKVRVLVDFFYSRLGDPLSTGEKKMFENDPNFQGDPLDIKGLAKYMTDNGVEVLDSRIDTDGDVDTDDRRLSRRQNAISDETHVSVLHTDHRKFITIDGRVAYCGSANLGAQYMFTEPFNPAVFVEDEAKALRKQGHPEPWLKWHDGLVRFEGPTAQELERVFRERWVLDGGEDFAPTPAVPSDSPDRPIGDIADATRVVTSSPSGWTNKVRELFKEMILNAQSNIFIESPYFYQPDIVDALIEAKERNSALRVDIIVPSPELNDSTNAQDANEYRFQRYLPAGINVFEYQNHFTHLKLATFDDRYSIVGSASMNYRSLEDDRDFEAVVLVDGPATACNINANVRDFDEQFSVKFSLEDVTKGKKAFVLNNRTPATVIAELARQL